MSSEWSILLPSPTLWLALPISYSQTYGNVEIKDGLLLRARAWTCLLDTLTPIPPRDFKTRCIKVALLEITRVLV